MDIPFYRPSLTEAEKAEVLECLNSGWLTTGPRTKRFEQDFAREAMLITSYPGGWLKRKSPR